MTPWPEKKRLSIARQFFELHKSLNPPQITRLLGNKISEATVRRDLENCQKTTGAKAPSMDAAIVYANAMGTVDGFDIETPGGISGLVEKALEVRRRLARAVPTVHYRTSTEVKYPKGFVRIHRRVTEENWTSVIDLIEAVLEADVFDEKFRPLLPYLYFYLGVAYQREGDFAESHTHYQQSLDHARRTNHEFDLRADAAIAVAFSYVYLGTDTEHGDIINRLLDDALLMGNPRPVTFANVLALATTFDDTRFGWWSRAVLDRLRQIQDGFDWVALDVMLKEDSDLKFFHNDDILKEIFDLVQRKAQEQ